MEDKVMSKWTQLASKIQTSRINVDGNREEYQYSREIHEIIKGNLDLD